VLFSQVISDETPDIKVEGYKAKIVRVLWMWSLLS
jgi:hypothetical protein